MIRLVAVSVFLAACTAAPAATSTPAPSAPPTLAPTASPTLAPTPSPSPSPTAAPTETELPAPTDSPSATAGEGLVISTDPSGSFLTDPDGFSLYTFDNDSPGESSCNGDCAENWPPLVVADAEDPVGGEGVDGTFSTITRDGGALQVTYNDAPLYLFAGDDAPGDTNGDGVGDVWHLATP